MGLDMYLVGRRRFWPGIDEEEGYLLKEKVYDLGYWRKHPDLHGYIVNSHAGGDDNCQPIQLTQDDIQGIMAAIKEQRLPKTTGFFFGDSNTDAAQRDSDVAVFLKALLWLQNSSSDDHRTVEYQASW
jgi:hypothetical protein